MTFASHPYNHSLISWPPLFLSFVCVDNNTQERKTSETPGLLLLCIVTQMKGKNEGGLGTRLYNHALKPHESMPYRYGAEHMQVVCYAVESELLEEVGHECCSGVEEWLQLPKRDLLAFVTLVEDVLYLGEPPGMEEETGEGERGERKGDGKVDERG